MVRALAVAVLGLASSALAFQVPAPVARPSTRMPAEKAAAAPAAAAEFSKSVPFLLRPKNIQGMVGDVGFDPLGFSDYIDVRFLREAELKNGRVAMLAVLGFIVQEFVRLPGELYSEPNGVKAFFQVGPQPLIQIFLFCGVLEFVGHKGKLTIMDMFTDGREPGNFGFDPLKLGADPSKRERLALSELKNGRLAMIAIGGLIHHALLTGHATFSS